MLEMGSSPGKKRRKEKLIVRAIELRTPRRNSTTSRLLGHPPMGPSSRVTAKVRWGSKLVSGTVWKSKIATMSLGSNALTENLVPATDDPPHQGTLGPSKSRR